MVMRLQLANPNQRLLPLMGRPNNTTTSAKVTTPSAIHIKEGSR